MTRIFTLTKRATSSSIFSVDYLLPHYVLLLVRRVLTSITITLDVTIVTGRPIARRAQRTWLVRHARNGNDIFPDENIATGIARELWADQGGAAYR